MPLSAGEKLGLYEILAPIGAGGMGEVYKARDTKLDYFFSVSRMSLLARSCRSRSRQMAMITHLPLPRPVAIPWRPLVFTGRLH